MHTRVSWSVAFAAVMCALTAGPGRAQQPSGNPEGEAALMERAKAFVEAFGKGDAKALADFWTPSGDYIDETGRHLKGREAIQKAFEEMFAENKGMKLRIDIASLRFVTPDVAIEDGTAAVIPPDGGPPSQARYTIVHVKKDGQWYLDSVRDAPFAPPSNYEHLRGLDWIIGDWMSDTSDGECSRVSFGWTEDQNFITSSFSTGIKDVLVTAGKQWIGWDPMAKQIRSWTFGSGGDFGEGSWRLEGDTLAIRTVTILRDGKKVTAMNIVKRMGEDTVTWESRDRSMDGKPLPDIAAIKMKRVGEGDECSGGTPKETSTAKPAGSGQQTSRLDAEKE